ncbi:MAG TPA: ABC transporter permease, partial [Actinomycetota bacterium]|nr:ABC transporter permease [Actinomycetota bacterium]
QSLAPRLTSAVVYGVIGWAFLIEFLGSAVKVSHWVMDTSIFFHITPAPAANPDWTGIGILVGLALACAAAAGMVFRRRDLADA